MSSSEAPRCRHIKVNGIRCGSPALRHEDFCFYHQHDRPWQVECLSGEKYAVTRMPLPYFEDAYSVQTVIRQVAQMILRRTIEQKTASTLLYALQIASSNLKRLELEKPQPDQVVVDLKMDRDTIFAALAVDETGNQAENENEENEENENGLPPGTIQACYQPWPQARRAAKSGCVGQSFESSFATMPETRAAQTPLRHRVT
jgi:hypothetical protein